MSHEAIIDQFIVLGVHDWVWKWLWGFVGLPNEKGENSD